jgi:hypothetical protein
MSAGDPLAHSATTTTAAAVQKLARVLSLIGGAFQAGAVARCLDRIIEIGLFELDSSAQPRSPAQNSRCAQFD